jgi:hypothetical protein
MPVIKSSMANGATVSVWMRYIGQSGGGLNHAEWLINLQKLESDKTNAGAPHLNIITANTDQRGNGLFSLTGTREEMDHFALVVLRISGDLCSGSNSYSIQWIDANGVQNLPNGTRTDFCNIDHLVFNRHCWSCCCSSRITYAIDDLRVYDGRLSDDDVQTLYTVGAA